MEAWLGSLPGNSYANQRRPLINSFNLANLLPLTVQTVLMMGIALALNKHPSGAVLLGSPGLELAVCCWAVAFASGLLGLAVSAFVSSSEQVIPVQTGDHLTDPLHQGGPGNHGGDHVLHPLVAWDETEIPEIGRPAAKLGVSRVSQVHVVGMKCPAAVHHLVEGHPAHRFPG